MRLHSLLPLLEAHPTFADLVSRVEHRAGTRGDGKRTATPVLSAITPARPYALAALYGRLKRPLLLVVARPGQARWYADELRAWVADPDDVCLFPETDALPYDYLPNDPDKLADRLGVLQRLVAGDGRDGPEAAGEPGRPPLVVASARAAIDLLTGRRTFAERQLRLRPGASVGPARLAEQLLALGYEPSPVVDQPGAFSRRGGILDVFPPGRQPARLEFWGDEVDTIRAFDPSTQRTTHVVDEAIAGPAHEVLPAPLPQPLDLSSLRPAHRGPFERDLRHLDDGQAFAALEFYRGCLGNATLVDYLPADGLLAIEEPASVAAAARDFEEQVERLHTDLLERGEVPVGLAPPYRSWADVERKAAHRLALCVGFDPDAATLPIEHAPKFGGRVEAFLDDLASGQPARERSVVVSQQSERLHELLTERSIAAARADEPTPGPETVSLLHGLLREGWASDEFGVRLFTDSEIFGWTKQRRAGASRRTEHQAVARETFVADLKPGDLVVHEDHGIARYRGLVSTAIGFEPGQRVTAEHVPPGHSEYLLLEYAEGDRLYVPIGQADSVGRYIGAGDADPTLTRLGSGEWSRAKARVRRSVRDIARELMDLYASRQTVEGHSFPDDTAWQLELEASFPFVETPDQLTAVNDVKADMERAKPMDRLLVGDVGFGKTEVALRAAFKAVQDGKQVAVLVPTTVLAQQHFNTFKDRLAPFPVRVEMLSRFRSDREQREVIRGLADGSVDICIGTHRLVQKDVAFKSLGLVVIDEEQRFGVAHKERLKQLRKEVDVLTLTATPIPRTLHMGLVGVRDMSILETAPEARLPVRTYVAEHDDGLIREAIVREIDRGGQVYFVHNRIVGIETVAARLRRLVPEARIAIAHGQMPEEDLEQTMLAFAEGEYDVLVCTTIIESGLDIPNANTLIVNNAHRFGLAQLYQLRGRVGRSTTRAYAYFLYTKDLTLSEVASERLKTIFEATELGAGMRIAMKDLEIRGAGNLLGAEQSGNISTVGFDLYTKLLAEQVALLRAREAPPEPGAVISGVEEPPPGSIDLPVPAFLPPEYVPDDPVRLRLYQRFSAAASDAELKSLVDETVDRFGPLPEPAQNLVYLTSLRLRVVEAAVRQIVSDNGEIVVRLDRAPPLSLDRIARTVGAPLKRGSNQVRLPRGKGAGWMGQLYTLVENLAPEQGEMPSAR